MNFERDDVNMIEELVQKLAAAKENGCMQEI